VVAGTTWLATRTVDSAATDAGSGRRHTANTTVDTLYRPIEWRQHVQQVALLWQRDRATRLSVEILQLTKHPI